jgi:hypothetical protein
LGLVPGRRGAAGAPPGPCASATASGLTVGMNAMKESLLAAIGIWLAFVLVFTSLVGA